MDQSVHAAGRCCRSRNSSDQICIQDRISRKQLIAEYSQLILAAVICDHGKSRNLRACTCCGRDSNQRYNVSRHLMCALILCNAAAKLSQYTYRLGHIHGGTSTISYDKVSTALFKLSCSLIHSLHTWISFTICKSCRLDACFCQQ